MLSFTLPPCLASRPAQPLAAKIPLLKSRCPDPAAWIPLLKTHRQYPAVKIPLSGSHRLDSTQAKSPSARLTILLIKEGERPRHLATSDRE